MPRTSSSSSRSSAASVIVASARTPIGKLSGSLSSLSAAELGGVAIAAALTRAGIDPVEVDHVVMGHVLQAGQGQNPARQAAAKGGLPMEVPAVTVNSVCLSGLHAIYLADQMIQSGEADVVVAGGMESMSQAPYLLPGARAGWRLGDVTAVDSMIRDGLWCAFDDVHMGAGTEAYVKQAGISRSLQDELAAKSHERAAIASKEGRLAEEIVPVTVRQRREETVVVDDEGIRPDSTVDSLARLRPAFSPDGTITAGNASQISDGAAALVVVSRAKAEELGLSVLAELAGFGIVAGPDPSLLTQPSRAIHRALESTGRTVADVDLFEINEAFAAVSAASMADLGVGDEVVNVNGGAIALGHPIGMSGTRVVMTLIGSLRRGGGGLGAAALCGGGGQGEAALIVVNACSQTRAERPPNMNVGGWAGQLPDIEPALSQEWLDSLDEVVDAHGAHTARLILARLLRRAGERDVGVPAPVSTPYLNSIAPGDEPDYPGDVESEARIEAVLRWNTVAMVTRANIRSEGIGGHLSTPASATSLYEMGYNHFFRGRDDGQPGDQVFFQGHATPGIYARAFMEGRLDEGQLDRFRREIGGGGLSSYPHPRLMPDFWEFPTVSMGLGPINAVYQARFNRYLTHRGVADTSSAHVWSFLGDGECDEPESLGALSLAAREGLDNLIFVVNCNLQRLDGPVRGNGKVIQELESLFRGAGWNVIKVIWGSRWDDVLADDVDGVLVDRMNSTLDGQFQKYAVEGGAYAREHFFGGDARLLRMVEKLPDDEPLLTLPRGGHDRQKLFAAYAAAVAHEGAPTVILAKTIKGAGLGHEVEARNAAHQIKKMSRPQLGALRDRLNLGDQVADEALDTGLPPYLRLTEGSPEQAYFSGRRHALGGAVPRRMVSTTSPGQPAPAVFDDLLGGSGDRAVSTTMVFARLLRSLLKDETVGRRIVPIVPDEARTFGLDPLFGEVGIYAPGGQRYEPVDGSMRLAYRERADGQILEEGITEAGAMASFTAAGTSYATWGEPMIPFYVFYSMFGFQRVGDMLWAFGDVRGRGFVLGATAGRTTLNGEGLQHQDGHSLLLASTVPNLAAYDPAFAYELSTIVRDGMARMYGDEPEDVFYYLTLYNENYPMPAMPGGLHEGEIEAGIIKGLYRFAAAPTGPKRPAVILFSGTAQGAAREAQQVLADEHDVAAELWSVTSYKALREEALAVTRWNRLHPTELSRTPYLTEALSATEGPFVAVTDFMKAVPDQVARWVPGHLSTLGTDGYGRSDSRSALRRHFETDTAHVVVAVLAALADTDDAKPEEVADAIVHYGIEADAVEPRVA